MLIDPIYSGSGIGNQLACYVTTRCLALDKGYDFRVVFPERWKGFFFKNIILPEVKDIEVPIEGEPPTVLPEEINYYKESMENNGDYDDFILNIPDNYMIHGNLQGEKYFEKHKDEIREWLAVEPMDMPDDLCILAFRGGEYVGVKDFFLPIDYWLDAMENMERINPNMKFKIVTDDVETANRMLPWIEATHEESMDWRSIRYAKYIILSNSSFGWFPAWLNQDVKKIIAPLYWCRYNLGYWFLEQNKTKGFWYQDKEGILSQI
jgi:hypothetical protein